MYYKGLEIVAINYLKKSTIAIYQYSKIIWQAINSCFGGGSWNNDSPFDNDEAWSNE